MISMWEKNLLKKQKYDSLLLPGLNGMNMNN